MQITVGENAAASPGLASRGRVGGASAFRLLLMGSSVSLLGSQVTAIGYPMLVLYLTGSPVTAGWVACAAIAPSVLAYIPAGVLVDRSDPWRTMLLSEIGRGCAIATVVAALAIGRASVPLLIAVAVIEQTLEVFSVLAEPRCVGSLVSRDEAGSAFVRIEARTHLVTLLGRPLGGLLFGLRPILPFLSDALSFGVSTATLISIRSMRRPAPNEPRVRASWHLGNDVRDGLVWLFHNNYVRLAIVLCSATTLTAQALIMVILGEAHSGHVPAFMVGVVIAAPGAGGVAGSIVASRLPANSRNQWLRIQMCVWCVMLAALAMAGGPSLPWMAAAMIVLGFTGALGNVEVGTYLMETVEHTMLARVTSIGRLMSFGACAIGPVLGGTLFEHYGAEKAIVTLFVITTVLAIVSLLAPAMRAENRDGGCGIESLPPDAAISAIQPQCGIVTAD